MVPKRPWVSDRSTTAPPALGIWESQPFHDALRSRYSTTCTAVLDFTGTIWQFTSILGKEGRYIRYAKMQAASSPGTSLLLYLFKLHHIIAMNFKSVRHCLALTFTLCLEVEAVVVDFVVVLSLYQWYQARTRKVKGCCREHMYCPSQRTT